MTFKFMNFELCGKSGGFGDSYLLEESILVVGMRIFGERCT